MTQNNESVEAVALEPSLIAERVDGKNHSGRPVLEFSHVRTPVVVSSGPWSGHLVRRSRKMGKCANRCGHHLPSGVLYLQGDVDPYEAGGFGHDRICIKCAGPMVRHAIAHAEQVGS